MNSDNVLSLVATKRESVGAGGLSIALIGPDVVRRNAAANVLSECKQGKIREYSAYPISLSDVPPLLEQRHDVIILDLDGNQGYALELVECICAQSTATVMVYSEKSDSSLLIHSMRAGAREFLTLPFDPATVYEALVRASARSPETHTEKNTGGRLMVFLGAKGGDGATTLACNFAVSLAKESGQSTLLIDLNLPLGDAALNLGVSAQYSTVNALQNASRLDASFLSTMLVKHSSGVSVLAAPGKFPQYDATDVAVDKLVSVARQEFENVVIDVGTSLDWMKSSLFGDGSTVYLVIQDGIAGLRNANRLIRQYFSNGVSDLEIVLNRYHGNSHNIAEEEITRALTRPAQWKIPNDYAAVLRMQHTAVPLAMEDSPISRLIRQMARKACGLPEIVEKEKTAGFSFRNLTRSLAGKASNGNGDGSITTLGLTAPRDEVGSEREEPAAVERIFEPAATAPSTANADAPAAPVPIVNIASETRTYRGLPYVKGADGKWHLQMAVVDGERRAAAELAGKELPVISWPTPAAVVFGTALGPRQYTATASVEGRFAYDPAPDEVLPPGVHTLTATFIPDDGERHATTQASVLLTVTRATPVLTWPAPASISYGAPLDAKQLNATASVGGRFTYSPTAGEVLKVGVHTLTATFIPDMANNYTKAQTSVSLTVTRSTPSINWPDPAPILTGSKLDTAQLNATAAIPGSFAYNPAAGTVLATGTHPLMATFTPADTDNYTEAQCVAALTVAESLPEASVPEQVSKEVSVEAKAVPATQAPDQSQALKQAIDSGAGLDLTGTVVFPDGTKVYLVMQPGSAGEQESKNQVSQFLTGARSQSEIKINK